jgi:hypothetical protein
VPGAIPGAAGNIEGAAGVAYRPGAMPRLAPLLLAGLVAGCATSLHEDQIAQVRAGMSRDEVQGMLGAPESATYAPGRDCAYYTILKSFWRRTPWSLTERYSVCYAGGRVEAFGRVPDTTGSDS